MADIGLVGMGKLGLPVALAIESRGHSVMGYDLNPDIEGYISREIPYPHQEEGLNGLLNTTHLKVAQSVAEVVAHSDIIFLPIETPHDPRFEGTTRIPEDRKDFDYRRLEVALADVANACSKLAVKKTVAVISTCLPGTYEKKLKPILNEYTDYVYTPQFIAMGGVIEDYLNPEFNLIGVESEEAADQLERFYATINDAPNIRTDITTAEGIKVSYNTWITAKTVLANAWGEMAHKTGMNFDDIKAAWDVSTKRLISKRYMDAGTGDGGGCHPRDNIAMSWLAGEVGMSHNIWEDLMEAREQHMEWLATEAAELSKEHELPLVIMGRSFKPETNIETGSPAVLASNILKEKEVVHQHFEDLEGIPQRAVYLIATKHERYKDLTFPKGSVVLDCFRYIPEQNGVTIIHVGNKRK